MGTLIEGPADDVWKTVRAAFEATLDSGAESSFMIMKLGVSNHTVDELQASGRAASATNTPCGTSR